MLDRTRLKSENLAKPIKSRDLRIDLFRGLALLMIFINHVPGTAFEGFTNRNFGFSDAAEGFVVMSGIAAGLAYSGRFRTGGLWSAISPIFARARTLYLVHVTTTMMAIGIFAFAALYFDLFDLLGTINLKPLFVNPLGVLIGLPTLGHQLGYFNILPLYLVLLLATPLFIIIGMRHPLVLLSLSVLLWIAAGQFRLNLPNYPNAGGWFFNPFSWQLIFVIGLLTGMALKSGKRFVPRSNRLIWLSFAILVATLIWMKVLPIGQAANHGLSVLKSWGLPFYITDFDKTFLSVPRLVHVLALFYFLSTQAFVLNFANSRWATPLVLLGRHALPVFATGSVLCIALQAVRAGIENTWWSDATLLIFGLVLQLALALLLDWNKKTKSTMQIAPYRPTSIRRENLPNTATLADPPPI